MMYMFEVVPASHSSWEWILLGVVTGISIAFCLEPELETLAKNVGKMFKTKLLKFVVFKRRVFGYPQPRLL